MKVTRNVNNPKLFDVDYYSKGKRIRKRGLKESEISNLTDERQRSAARSSGNYNWAKAFDHCVRVRWCNAKDKGQMNKAYKILSELHLWGQNPEYLDIRELFDHIDQRDNNLLGQTKNKYLSAINVILQEAFRIGDIKTHPTMPNFSTTAPAEKTTITDEHMQKMDDWFQTHSDSTTYAYWQFCVQTGCRPKEAYTLTWRGVSDTSVTFSDTKNGTTRTLPIPRKPPIEFLKKRSEDLDELVFKGFDRSNFNNRIWVKMIEDLNLKDYKYVPYSIRHTKVTNLLRANHPVAKVKTWAGHKHISTTMIYTHMIETDLEDMI